jgi:hypothetical protein
MWMVRPHLDGAREKGGNIYNLRGAFVQNTESWPDSQPFA